MLGVLEKATEDKWTFYKAKSKPSVSQPASCRLDFSPQSASWDVGSCTRGSQGGKALHI